MTLEEATAVINELRDKCGGQIDVTNAILLWGFQALIDTLDKAQ